MHRILWYAIMPALCGCYSVEREASKLWVAHLEKMTNWIQADAEAMKYKTEENEARLYLKELREIEEINELSIKLKADGFHWKNEYVDFTSYPWVTIARRRGDCDDFTALWDAILKYRDGKTEKVFVSTSSSAHAMLVYNTGDKIYILSNLDIFRVGKPGEEEDLVGQFFGDKTKIILRY